MSGEDRTAKRKRHSHKRANCTMYRSLFLLKIYLLELCEVFYIKNTYLTYKLKQLMNCIKISLTKSLICLVNYSF